MNKVINPLVLIIAHKEVLNEFEKASLRQCFNILGKHKIKIIFPKGFNHDEYDLLQKCIDYEFVNPKWLSTYERFNQLKISSWLYSRYNHEFTHILFYELDAWVFEDQLLFWCNKTFDYIGAPWCVEFQSEITFTGIGNGGFSLRNINSHLRCLSYLYNVNFKYIYLRILFYNGFGNNNIIAYLLRKLSRFNYFKSSYRFFKINKGVEDVFWCKIIPNFNPDFKVAPLDDAIKFSFEMFPEKLYELNNFKLPFGCHGFNKYNKNFWDEFIKFL